MKISVVFGLIIWCLTAQGQQAVVDVTLRPAGSFKGVSTEIKGFAMLKGNTVEAQNITVGLKNIKTGITLRDEHTRRHLQIDQFPEAVLVSAKGQNGKGEGLIKIKGIQKKIAGTYKIEGQKLLADFPIKFSDFGIVGVKYMGIGVQDDGMIHVAVPIQK